MKILPIVSASALLLLPGCAVMDRSAMSYKPDFYGQSGQRVFIWKSNYSAGIASNGGVCAQGALTAEAKSRKTTASVSTDVINALTKLPASAAPGDLAKIARSENNNIMLTNATNGQTAFANLAFFYLCQISLNNSSNGHLTGEQIVAMWSDTVKQISSVSSDAKDVQTLLANQTFLDGSTPPSPALAQPAVPPPSATTITGQ